MADHIPELTILSTKEPARLRIAFSFEGAPPQEAVQALGDAVRAFVAVGAHAGYATPIGTSVPSSLELLGMDVSRAAGPWFELRARGLDFRAFSILRNLCTRISAKVHPITSIAVHGQGDGAETVTNIPIAEWGTEHQAYPAVAEQLSFPIERGDPLDYHKTRRALVEFGRAVEAGVFGALIERVREWMALAEGGGFSPPVKPADLAAVWEDSIVPFDAFSVEVAMRLFESSEFAWNVLLNLVEAFSLTVEPVASVTIE